MQLIDKGYEKKKIACLLGEVTIRRVRYRCTGCQKDYYQLDSILELSSSKASKRLGKSITQIAAFIPFKETKKMLFDLTGIEDSTTFIENVTVKIGKRLDRDMQKKARRPYSIKDREDEVEILYIGADGAMVPLIGEKNVEYMENKLGIVFNNNDIVHKKTKKGETSTTIEKKRLVSSLANGVELFTEMLFAAAIEKGYHAAKEVVFLIDGAI